jgi:hypothetical protein
MPILTGLWLPSDLRLSSVLVCFLLVSDLVLLTTATHLLRSFSLSLILRLTVSRPVYLGIKHPFGANDQIFISVRQLRVSWCEALSLTRGRVCRLQLLLAFASTVILWSKSRGTHDHILLCQFRDFPFRRLLRLAGLRWRYSTLPPHGILTSFLSQRPLL